LKLADRARWAAPIRRSSSTHAAVAWMAYGIHGDELSSCDAALELAYQLMAGTDAATKQILDNCVVVIDPAENPDGRSRWITQLTAWNSVTPSPRHPEHEPHRHVALRSHQSLSLRSQSRLVCAGAPETRGKTKAIMEWMPHLHRSIATRWGRSTST
jgi:hypothetical protein